MEQTTKPRWLDLSVNIQSVLFTMLGCAGGAIVMWYSLVGRVQALEYNDRQQDQHFTRIEGDMQQQRADVKEQLRSISADVKDTNSKIDALRDQLLQNNVSNRPDVRRWAR